VAEGREGRMEKRKGRRRDSVGGRRPGGRRECGRGGHRTIRLRGICAICGDVSYRGLESEGARAV
jgi:hypothetical protein